MNALQTAYRFGEAAPVGRVRIGCSGWNYRDWRGRFYPPGLPQRSWLSFYAQTFDSVELNNSFYRLPEAETFSAWRDGAPEGFCFAVKASRFLTHLKRLRDPEEPVQRLFERASRLGPTLGPVLYQLPGSFRRDVARLAHLLEILPARFRDSRGTRRSLPIRHVFEFRDPSWYHPDVFELLDRAGAALCLHDRVGSEIRDPVVGPFTYVRFHGSSGNYHGSYDTEALDRWADRFREMARAGRDVYAYFNNDPEATAVRNAKTLNQRLAGHGATLSDSV